MSKPAKDEAELMERVAEALYDNYDLDLPMSFTLAAIRKAGWAVVPVEPTEKMLTAGIEADYVWRHNSENARIKAILQDMLAAAPGVKP